jgi:serine/threonine protein kinase
LRVPPWAAFRHDGGVSDAPLPGVAGTDPLLGLAIGNYTITSKLGEGGMGAVYLAEHPEIGKKVAVKVLLPEHSKRQDLITRFFNEAKTTAQLRHPALVEVFDFGFLPDGAGYLVMDYLDGESLAGRLARVAPLPPETTAEVGRQLAAGVACAHKNGIVHRDLKPDNIFLVPDPELAGGERVKILDFGIAKLVEPGTGGSKGSTSTGMLLGTPLYMAPEQCRGSGTVDHRADVYSAGCILYQMLASRPPFDFEGVGEILAAHLYQVPKPLTEIDPSLPPALVDIVTRALAKDPAQRQQTMTELGTELATFLRGGEAPVSSGSGGYARVSAGASGGTLPLVAHSSVATPARSGEGARPSGRNEAVRSGAAPVSESPARVSKQAAAQGSIATAPTSYVDSPPPVEPRQAPPPATGGRPPWLFLGFLGLAIAGGAGFFVLRGRNPAPAAVTDPAAGKDPATTTDPATTASGTAEPETTAPGTTTAGATATGSPDPAAPTGGDNTNDPPLGTTTTTGAGDEATGAGTAATAKNETTAAEKPDKPANTGRPGRRPSGSNPEAGNSRALALYNEGFAHRYAGREDLALLRFRAAIRAGGLPPNKRSEVDTQIISLSRKFGEIEVFNDVAGTQVSVDGIAHGRTPLPNPILVKPGSHQVSLQIPGQPLQQRTIKVAAGGKVPIRLRR